MNKMDLLIVEDESIVAMEIESYVTSLGYYVTALCTHGEEAVEIVEHSHVNIVLMDIYLKGEMDGIEAAEIIKTDRPEIEIIFLTAHMDDYNIDKAIALDPVAYLSKPFHPEELKVFLKIATSKIQKNTLKTHHGPNILHLDEEFCYDTSKQQLFYHNEPIHLTNKEHSLLHLLLMHKNHIIDTYSITNLLWPDKETNPNTVRTLIRRLREKLKHKFIETIPAQGYRLRIPAQKRR